MGRVAIAGVGLIGGSLGLALRRLEHPPEVIGIHGSPESVDRAVSLGATDQGTTSVADGVQGADLLVVAAPVRSILPRILEAMSHLPAGAIITDVGSTKSEIVALAEAQLRDDLHFIGGHPMAGSELTGVENASPSLFEGAYWLLTPTSRTETEAYERLHALVASVGAKVLALTPEEHDQVMAVISHLPHLVSASLVNTAGHERGETEQTLLLTAGGFRDITRIAGSSPEVWVDICLTNRQAILSTVEQFQGQLGRFIAALKEEDEYALFRLFAVAREVRQNLPGVLPAAPERLYRLRVMIPDRPGAISEITLAIGRRGINIEDLQMIHIHPGERAVLEMALADRERGEEAASALKDAGYELHASGEELG